VSTTPITSQIFAIRDRWHTKRHPFFRALAEGKLALKALGRYQALHYHFVAYAVRSFGLFYTRFYDLEDVRKMMAENLAEEEGFKAIPQAGHEPHDHTELILRFCRATGLSDEEVRNMKMLPAWWARSLYYYNTVATEPVGVVLAMQHAGRPDAGTDRRGSAPRLRAALRLQAHRARDRVLHRARFRGR
jgi:pyrroloquinoline quinone (PQQ) biosynthesis protein C